MPVGLMSIVIDGYILTLETKTKDQKDILYIKTRGVVIKNPCGVFDSSNLTFREYVVDNYDKVSCPCCKTVVFKYDCLIDNEYVIRSIDLHVLRYHRDIISATQLNFLKQVVGVVD
jgi:hypothetical protein